VFRFGGRLPVVSPTAQKSKSTGLKENEILLTPFAQNCGKIAPGSGVLAERRHLNKGEVCGGLPTRRYAAQLGNGGGLV
jgi:hypothetical protein